MNMVFLLLAEFETVDIPLSKLCEKYLGISPALAAKRATAGKLPVPTFRGGKSQQSPWLVNIRDLAEWLDKQQKDAREEFKKINS